MKIMHAYESNKAIKYCFQSTFIVFVMKLEYNYMRIKTHLLFSFKVIDILITKVCVFLAEKRHQKNK